MTCISHKHKFALVHMYKEGGTSVTDFFLPYSRLRERASVNRFGRKFFYTTNILQELLGRGSVPKGASSWYMGVEKHARMSEVVRYLGSRQSDYKIFSVIRDPVRWIGSLYSYISVRSFYALHNAVRSMSFSEFLTHFVENRRALQSDLIMGVDLAGQSTDARYLNALFGLESLSENIGFLASYLNLPTPDEVGMRVLNLSPSTSLVDELPLALRERLFDYLSPDFRLYRSVMEANGCLLRHGATNKLESDLVFV